MSRAKIGSRFGWRRQQQRGCLHINFTYGELQLSFDLARDISCLGDALSGWAGKIETSKTFGGTLIQ